MRKFMTILLALTMCLSLAGSAFAEGKAEAPAPEEQTETLAAGAETPAEDAEAEDATPGAEETPEEADQALGDQLAQLMEEGELAVGEPYVLGVKYGHLHVDSVETMDLPDPEDIVVGEAYTLGVYYGHLCFDDSCPDMPDPVWDGNAAAAQSEAGVCPECGKDNWGPPTDQDPYAFEEIVGVDYHAECFIRIYACNTANCDGVKKLNLAWIVPHTWSSNPVVSYSSNGADTHTVRYIYTCTKCRVTKTATESEAHTLYKTGTVDSHYHWKTNHYIRWNAACSKCGYTTIELEILPCPGNENGVGCITVPPLRFDAKPLDPPNEAQDAAPPEDVTEAEAPAPLDEAIGAEETVPPGDEGSPGRESASLMD